VGSLSRNLESRNLDKNAFTSETTLYYTVREVAEMRKEIAAVVFVSALLFLIVVDAQPVEAALATPPYMEGPLASIYILSDGTVTGTSRIQVSGNTYTFTDNIKGYLVVQKDSVVIDGAGYTLSGEGSLGTGSLYAVEPTTGINLLNAKGVTIQDLKIVNFVIGMTPATNAVIKRNYIAYNQIGIAEPANAAITENYIEYNDIGISSGSTPNKNNKIIGNTIANNNNGIEIMLVSSDATNDVISGNNFTRNGFAGIYLMGCSGVTISDNTIIDTIPGIGSNITAGPMGAGINFLSAHGNRVFGNYIADNNYGVSFSSGSDNNVFYGNDFINREQVAVIGKSEDASKLGGLVETWDNGTVGNYWSDYLTKNPNAAEIGGSGIGDTPYTIDSKNVDHYPLMAPVNAPAPSEVSTNTYLTARPSLAGSQIKIEGTLSYGGTSVSFAALQVSYSLDSDTSWNEIGTVNTDANGDYSATWLLPDVGTYQIKVSWEGNATIPEASTIVYLLVAASQTNDLISVGSNSTITLFNFNADTQEITFNVSGPSETTGYVKIYISKTLFQNVTEATVYLDGEQIDYVTSSTNDSWILYFVYSHSTHHVSVKIASTVVESPNSIVVWLATAVILACVASAGFLLYFRKHKH
jgi:parallel beta-helix repeat protein